MIFWKIKFLGIRIRFFESLGRSEPIEPSFFVKSALFGLIQPLIVGPEGLNGRFSED